MVRWLCLAALAAPFVFFAAAYAAPAPVPVQPVHNTYCHALAPAGWGIVDQDDRGATYSVASADRRMIAAYGIVGIASAQVAGYYGPQYRTPALFAQYLASTVAGVQVSVMGVQPFDGMQAMQFEGTGKRGFVLYRVYPIPSDPGGYVISARIAVGGAKGDAPVAGAVAAAIDCATTFKAPPGGYAQVHAKAAGTTPRAAAKQATATIPISPGRIMCSSARAMCIRRRARIISSIRRPIIARPVQTARATTARTAIS